MQRVIDLDDTHGNTHSVYEAYIYHIAGVLFEAGAAKGLRLR